MRDQSGPFESEIQALKQSMERLEARVVDLEGLVAGAGPTAADPPGVVDGPTVLAVAGEVPGEPGRVVRDSDPDEEQMPTLREMFEEAGANIGAGLIGGILLVLAGAYLLRALTDTGVLPRILGVASGLAYTLVWAVVCHLLGKRGRRGAASASGLAASLVALPMIWESTARFEVLTPWVSALLLILVGALLLSIAERHRLAPVSTLAVLGIGCVSLLLWFGTRRPEPFALTLGLLGIVSIYFGPRRGGPLPWLGYLFADLGALLLIVGSLGDRAIALPVPAVSILVGLFVATIMIIVLQSSRSGEVGPHQVIQGTLVTLLGFGGALLVAADHLPAIAKVLAAVGMTMGLAGYSFLLVTFRWSRQHRWVFLFHSSLALAIMAMCAWILFLQPAWLFSGFAVLLAVVGVLLDRVSPGLHAAMAVLLAAVVGELGGVIFDALAARGSDPWPGIGLLAAATLAAAVLCALLPLKVQSPVWPDWLPRVGRGAVILVAVLGIDAVLILLTAPYVAGDPGGFDPGTLAALRTGILAASVVVVAVLSRYERLQPSQRLVWPLLAAIALKLVVEDFPRGRAMTMAVALLLYGVALILATRLLRASREGASSDAASMT